MLPKRRNGLSLGKGRNARNRTRGAAFSVLLVATAATVFLAWDGGGILGSGDRSVPLNERARAYPFAYQVYAAEWKESLRAGEEAAEPQGRFFVVHLLAENVTDKPGQIDQSRFSLVDFNGNEYSPVCRNDLEGCPVAIPRTFPVRLVKPGERTRGVFVFDTRISAIQPYQLKIAADRPEGPDLLFSLQ